MEALTRYLSYFGALLARPPLFVLYLVSGLVPRRPDLWVFGSWGGHRFADNAASFFLYCQSEVSDSVRLVWISRDRDIVQDLQRDGYEAHHLWSPGGLSASLRAGLYLFDNFVKDINFWTSRGARTVNLWSGVPLKAFERDIDNPRSRYYRLFHGTLPERVALSAMMPWHVDRPDLIIATAQETARITERAFDIPETAVAITGYPRNDVLFRTGSDEGQAREAWPKAFREAVDAGRFIFFYLPTYRDSGKPFLDADWAEVDRLMERNNASLFLKLHPDDRGSFHGEGAHVAELPQGIDIYDLLTATDALISDYSSIIFDFMMLGRPIIHYLPDLDEYRTSSRKMVFDPIEIAVGPVCQTAEAFTEALASVLADTPVAPDVAARWAETRKRMNRHNDGGSNRRVLSAIAERFPELGVSPGRDHEGQSRTGVG
ncbi:MAG: CDP-glycerol glycerophosphotransferase family protein [Gemmatimonadales bacterium]|nr:MAG: CDP-glycerol glycerophosphotransferase family protein [Gemmatimonadales bacterium]